MCSWSAAGWAGSPRRWVERFGITARYRELRDGIRDHYRRHYPLTERARRARQLNPGAGYVSRLCHEPRVAVAVAGDRVTAVTLAGRDAGELTATAPYIVDPRRPASCCR
jgi:hypothetical protein